MKRPLPQVEQIQSTGDRARAGVDLIHVLIVFECVLLMIIGLDQFVRMPMPDRTEEATRGIESSADGQGSSMRAAIVTIAAAAGPDIMPSGTSEVATQSVLPGWPRGEALSQPEWQYSDVLASTLGWSGAMREVDRRAIARDLLGTVYDRVVPMEPFEASEADMDDDAVDAPLPRPTRADRPKTPQRHVNVLSAQPVARPGVLTNIPRTEAVPLSKLRAATSRRSAIRQEGAERSMARRSGYTTPRSPEDGGWLGSIVAGYQRFVGHNFNSVAHPSELQSYCRVQSDTWVFDEGSRRFLHCGQVTAAK